MKWLLFQTLLVSAALLTASGKPAGFFTRIFGATESVRDDTGGSTCVGCALILGVVEQTVELYNTTVDNAMEKLCSYLPGDLQTPCKTLISTYGPAVIELLEKKETPDIVCHAIGLCKTPSGTEMCHIFPLPSSSSLAKHHMSKHIQTLRHRVLEIAKEHELHTLRESLEVGALPNFCKWPIIDEICKLVDKWTGDHLPVDDLDGDKFSDLPTARGSSWRGKDCNDSSSDIYPGRRAVDGDAVLDSNCNGIVGIDDASGTPYEDLWCNGTEQFGTVVLGDSIGAHFHIPREWMNVTEISEAVSNIIMIFNSMWVILHRHNSGLIFH